MRSYLGKLLKLELLTELEIEDVCTKAIGIFITEPNIPNKSSPILVCGDIHGQFYDLISMFRINGVPPNKSYIFLGDYVDRGENSVGCICLLLILKIMYSDNVTLIRGNHEQSTITKMYGFYDEVMSKYGNSKVWKMICEVFSFFNMGCMINGRILCVHGGISPKLLSLNQLHRFDRILPVLDNNIFSDIVWSDPDDTEGFKPSPRGSGFLFGNDVFRQFLELNNLTHVLRSHQLVLEGYKFHFEERNLITVWSAPNYMGKCENPASCLRINHSLEISDKDMCIFTSTPRRIEFIGSLEDFMAGQ